MGRCSTQEAGVACRQKTTTSVLMGLSLLSRRGGERPRPARKFGGRADEGAAALTIDVRSRTASAVKARLKYGLLLALAAAPARAETSDYPTATRADYVIGCMAANGNTREALLKCSCAIDTIASLMPYADYEEAETALSLQAGGGVGGRVGLFRDPPEIKAVIEELRKAQAEANLQCR
jgi:hypothetical protein